MHLTLYALLRNTCSLFHGIGLNPYSPFGNVVLRVVSPRPRIEDLILQLLTPDETHNDDNNTPVESAQNPSQESSSSDNTPDDDVSERMAREMQAEEDREQEMRDRAVALGSQFGNLLSSFFGTTREDSFRPTFYQQPINAESGVCTSMGFLWNILTRGVFLCSLLLLGLRRRSSRPVWVGGVSIMYVRVSEYLELKNNVISLGRLFLDDDRGRRTHDCGRVERPSREAGTHVHHPAYPMPLTHFLFLSACSSLLNFEPRLSLQPNGTPGQHRSRSPTRSQQVQLSRTPRLSKQYFSRCLDSGYTALPHTVARFGQYVRACT